MDKYEFSAEQRALLEGLSQPFAIYQFLDKRVVTIVLSQGFLDLFGYEDRAKAYFDMDNDMYRDTHPDDTARIADAAYRFATEGGSYEVVYRTKIKDSIDYRIVHAMGKHVMADDGSRLAHVWYTDEGIYDVDGGSTELNRAFSASLREESLVRASSYDHLTGLPSMTYFFELAEAAKKDFNEAGEEPVMLYMDLCGMKYFNAQNSFAEGDRLLWEFSRILRQTFGNENCCHAGADHFAVYTGEAGIEETLERFFEECRSINGGNGLPVRVGIYPSRFEVVSASTACDRAKFACDSLSNIYESCYGYYDQALRDDAQRRRYILSNFERAIEERWIQVYYQPIIRAVNGRVCDEEALSRWIDPKYGMLSPIDYIPLLEEADLIYKLDLYVLEQVLEKIRLERIAGLNVVPHSINLSRSDFTCCDIVAEILKRVDASGIDRDRITIEITESTLGEDFEFMRKQVEHFRELGFAVWMDDFGSGYSSIDLLQSMEFDLIKFDMSFMRRLDEGEGGKIVLMELMRMATALGVDTLCEGVETAEQVRFLKEIGCAKLQGFHFCRPIAYETIVERYRTGTQIGFENPDETPYYEVIGRVNLYDLAVIGSEDDDAFRNYFSTLPMAIMELDGQIVHFVRTNRSYRSFMERFFKVSIEENSFSYEDLPFNAESTFMQFVRRCCETGSRSFFDETMADGSVVHSFVKKIGTNPVNGKDAVAIAVLSINDPHEGATYAGIARALAADYYNIFYVDMDTGRFIEYSSPVGGDELAMERHGEDFFKSTRHDAMMRIYDADREQFLASFTPENIMHAIESQGVFTITYRLVDNGEPVYANMKVTRLRANGNKIIIGISIIDAQMKRQALLNKVQRERNVLGKVMALSENYLTLYAVDPATGSYLEYTTGSEYATLGIAKEGDDFFEDSRENGKKVIYEEDLPKYLAELTQENVMRAIEENGMFKLQYRLMINGEPKPVSLWIAKVKDGEEESIVAGVRAWRKRSSDAK